MDTTETGDEITTMTAQIGDAEGTGAELVVEVPDARESRRRGRLGMMMIAPSESNANQISSVNPLRRHRGLMIRGDINQQHGEDMCLEEEDDQTHTGETDLITIDR